MMTSATPRFREGDPVISFRSETARVKRVCQVDEPGKSHRVQVVWTDELRNPDNVEYYEEVFEPWVND